MFLIIVVIAIVVIPGIIVLVNFISFLGLGRLVTNRKLWMPIQVSSVIIVPAWFLVFMDYSNPNDCCYDTAVFSPEHRIGIYTLIILSALSFLYGVFRKKLLPPIAEVLHNSFLILGVLLNFLFFFHFATDEDAYLWSVIGNLPIILLMLLMLAENQQLLKLHIDENDYSSKTLFGKWSLSILKLDSIFKYPLLTILLAPIIIFLALFLILFKQKPDSMIRAFTETYRHGFSQIDHMCYNVDCGGHFLCSVGANGHQSIVKPIRYGERNGNRIICNRQLLVSNAFEELVEENFPKLHLLIRRNYNKVGNVVHKHYHIFNIKWVSDFVYILMKPLEIFFLITLYTFARKPENRIAKQYLARMDRESINKVQKED